MKRKVKVLPPLKNNDDIQVLFIACIHEHLMGSNFNEGPDLEKIQELLFFVYSKLVTLQYVTTLLIKAHNRLTYLEDGTIRLTNAGLDYFYLNRRTIIPPKPVTPDVVNKRY